MDKPENPPAFPLADHYSHDGIPLSEGSQGMTLRDWFAGQALQGLCAQSQIHAMSHRSEDTASKAYRLADAMLAQREVE